MSLRVEYLLLGFTGHRNRFVEISSADHSSVVTAMAGLLRVLGTEEKFDMLAENYDELEAELDAISRRGVLFQENQWSKAIARIYSVNRRLNNFMSTARLYLDHVDHDLSTTYGRDSEQRRGYQRARAAEYDTHFGYRACEALRNYAQHRGIPAHGISQDMARSDAFGHGKIVHRVSATVDLRTLRAEGEFKPDVLEELRAHGETVALKPLLREYVAGLSTVHTMVRHIFSANEIAWKERLVWAKLRFREATGDPEADVYEALVRREDGEVESSSPIFEDFLSRLEELRAKNAGIPDLTRQIRVSE